jgi:hypothetical protein
MGVTYELAVHLTKEKNTRAMKNHISKCGGLVHRTTRRAVEAARRIAKHEDVEWVNISMVSCIHVTTVRAVRGDRR